MKKFIPLTIAIIFTGCFTPYSQSPIATNFKTTYQHKLQAMYHWEVIAKNIADDIEKNFNKKDSIYIQENNSTIFNKTFSKMLKSELIRRKFTITTNPNFAKYTLNFSTQEVYFTRNLTKPNKAGYLLALGGGVFLLKDAPAGVIGASSIAAVEGYNYYNSKFDSIPHRELLINIDIKNHQKYVYSISKVYYIVDKDSKLYSVPKKETYKINIEGN